jgi:hypothetical protein
VAFAGVRLTPHSPGTGELEARAILRLVEPFAHPCARSTTAAQRRDSGPPPEARRFDGRASSKLTHQSQANGQENADEEAEDFEDE